MEVSTNSLNTDSEFVESVMAASTATQVNTIVTVADVHNRKRHQSDETSELMDMSTNKKPKTYDTDKSDILDAIHSLGSNLNSRIDSLEGSLADKIKEVVRNEVRQIKLEIDSKLNELTLKVKHLEQKQATDNRKVADELNELRSHVSDAAPDNVVVVKNLPVSDKEQSDSNVTINKVSALIKDGLKLHNVQVVSAERKKTSGSRPGVVIARLADSRQKQNVMKEKTKLKNIKPYERVYIENCLSRSELQTQHSLMTVVKELGKQDSYYVKGSAILKRRGTN